MTSPPVWRTLRLDALMHIMVLLPPPPVRHPTQPDTIVTFMDPKAAEKLHRIRELLMEAMAGSLYPQAEEILEKMARAHDAEECAQKGEPSPWRDDLVAQYKREEGEAAWMEWRSERLAAMRAAVQAVMP